MNFVFILLKILKSTKNIARNRKLMQSSPRFDELYRRSQDGVKLVRLNAYKTIFLQNIARLIIRLQ